jgi:toxin ParE1/3/4
MANFKLTSKASADIDRIYDFGIDRFGLTRANQYLDMLEQRFNELAKTPLTYPSVAHIRAEFRRSVCGVHSIYYRITPDGVEIIRVIGHQDFND